MATTEKTLITAEEFMRMDLGDGLHELVRGEVITLPPPMPLHGIICGNVYFFLSSFGRRTGHGYAISNDSAVQTEHQPDTVRGADVCYYGQARWPRSAVGMDLPPVLPDLVVEVASPSDRPGQIRKKVREYLDAGVPMVWVAYPKTKTVAIHRRDQAEPRILSVSETIENLPELPGFRCDVADFFI